MSSTVFRLPRVTNAALSALVIQPHLPHLLLALSALTSLGFDVTVAESFKDAKAAIASSRPALLLADIKLREYNGLHLVLRAQATWQGLPAIVTSEVEDAVLRQEAERLGATFVTLPISSEELTAAICRTVFGAAAGAVRAPFERRQAARRTGSAAGSPFPDRRLGDRRRDLAATVKELARRLG